MSPSEEQICVLDTNILINLSIWMPIELNRVFWNQMEIALEEGKWVLLDVVVDEIKNQNDGLKDWCLSQSKKGFVSKIDDSHRGRAAIINGQFKMIDDSTARSTVDTYLIAYAEAKHLRIFTREGWRKNALELYKIPDVCKMLSINCFRSPKDFFKTLGYKN